MSIQREVEMFCPSHVRTGAHGGESQATGKSRRTPSPPAQRSHHRLARHAEPGRLGGLHPLRARSKDFILADHASERKVKTLLSRLQTMSKKEVEKLAEG